MENHQVIESSVSDATIEQAITKIEFSDITTFESITAAINGLANKYRDLKITNTKSYQAVVKGIAEMRNLRIAVENRRKEKKAEILAAGRQIDTGAQKITALLLPIENDLKTLKQTEDDRKAAVKAEKERIEKERIAFIQAEIQSFPPKPSDLPQLLKMEAPQIQALINGLLEIEITPEKYQEFTQEAIQAKADKKELLQEYYIAKIQADMERKKQQVEAERQAQIRKEEEAKRRIEEERLTRIQAEQEAANKAEEKRLQKIKEEQEAELQQIREEQEKIENQKRIVKEKQERLERERQAKIEAEKQAKIRAEQAKQAEMEKRKAEKERKKRQAALRPDKENLLAYLETTIQEFNSMDLPSVKTKEGEAILSTFFNRIQETIRNTEKQVESLN